MLCPKCGYYSDREESVCPECGNILQHSSAIPLDGPQAIRQGKRAREAVRVKQEQPAPVRETAAKRTRAGRGAPKLPSVRDTRSVSGNENGETAEAQDDGGSGFERRRRTFYDESADEATAMKYLSSHEGGPPRRMVNWVKASIAAVILMMILAAGGYFFLKKTDAGQRFLARLGREASSVAYWAVGDEKMNSGDIEGAIECFQTAREKDAEEGVIDVDGLLTLGSALEAIDRTDEAAALYEEIYTETPSRTEAYVNHIRILQNSNDSKDLVKAGELMKLAYEKTGEKTFLTQRSDLLPAPPEVTPIAGYYETRRTLVFSSYQGYDVYYTYNNEDAVLPQDGIKATPEGFMLDEGIYDIRAVAVNGALVSDELRGTWKIIMPSPMTPRATLAPNTYKTRQSVKLKPGLDDERDTSIVIYYTIDGSVPDSDSPIFDGEPINLPNGWVTLKAYAVNRYRKLSNMLEIKYKIDAKPWPKAAFSEEDLPEKMNLMKTTQQEFSASYEKGTAAGSVQAEGFSTECRKFEYPWGYIVVNLSKKNWVLTEVCINASGTVKGPRETQVGDTLDYVIGQFRDMQQVESPSGNRGLYATDGGSTGKIWLQENGEKIIRYRYPVDSAWVQLEYLVSASGTVKSIDLKYIP